MSYKGELLWLDKTINIKNKAGLVEFLSNYPDDTWFEINVVPIGKTNNTNQSKLYFKWCNILAQEFGWDSQGEMHEYFKNTYLDGQSTKGLDTKGWSEYMIKVQAFANEHSINLPTGYSD